VKNKTLLVKYISKRTYVSQERLRYWLPVLLEVGEGVGYSQPEVITFMVIMGKAWANSPMAMQGLEQWLKGEDNSVTRLVKAELLTYLYRHRHENEVSGIKVRGFAPHVKPA